MKFDRTKGKSPRYLVSIYGETVEDKYYYHYFREADDFFDQLLRKEWEAGTAISLYDLQKDVRKNFAKF